jgi:putative ABC transport system permease protein
VLWRASLRGLLDHPWQTGLAILGIALGVAVVVSIDLADASARRAFGLATESVVGRATHQVVGGPDGLPEEVYRRLRVDLAVRPAAPVVEADLAAADFPGRTFHLLGVDPLAEGPFRGYLRPSGGPPGAALTALMTRPGAALLSAATARALGLSPGASLSLRVGAARRSVTVAGLLEPADPLSRQALESLLLTDLASAQELLDLRGRLSRIDLVIPESPAGDAILAGVQRLLPPGAEVVRSATRSQAIEQMLRAFSLNLAALSLLALLVGTFLIYNTVTFSVVQRRTSIGLLRALGVTRREIFGLVLTEALAIGVAGSLVGLASGVILARVLTQLVTRTINDLYFVLSVRDLAIPAGILVKGAALGLGATALASLPPAVEATSAPPRAVLSRSVLESRAERAVPRFFLLGLGLLLAGAGLLAVSGRSLVGGYVALFVLMLGFASLTPGSMVVLMTALSPLAGRLFGVLGRMAARDVVRALSRTAVATAALMIAIAATLAVGIMVQSFRATVERWLETTLQADVYVSAPGSVGGRPAAPLPPALVLRLVAVPGVGRVSTHRSVTVASPAGSTRLVVLGIPSPRYFTFRFTRGPAAAVWPAFEAGGAVIVSEPYAYRRRLGVGSTLRLRTDRGERTFHVAGVFYDYATDQGVVALSRRTYERFWDDRGVSGLAFRAAPGTTVPALLEGLRRAAGPADVLIRDNRALREASLVVFDRTFAITEVLRLLAALVAFAGVLSALMALGLERVHEVGVLRAHGLTPAQVWGLITSETGLIGLAAGLLAIPAGVALALVLVLVINRRSFGWTLEVGVGAGVLVHALSLALAAALLAGVVPAAKMARLSPAQALRDE